MSLQVFLWYLATWLLVAVTPGPAVMYAMSSATRYGFRSALAGVAGILLGHVVFFSCVACGLAALLATATTAFTLLRILGAVYLLYLGLRLLISTFRARERKTAVAAAPASRRGLLLQGFAIQVTNPKALLFMSAFLPQFIDPNRSLWGQLAILFATTVVGDALVLGTYAYLAERGAASLRASGLTVWLERVFGVTLLFFGVRLLRSRP